MLIENMNKSKEFMFMDRNVIENMDKFQVFMFTVRNVVENMNKQQVFIFSACRHTQSRRIRNRKQFTRSVFGKSQQRQLIVAKLTTLYRIHLYKKTFI